MLCGGCWSPASLSAAQKRKSMAKKKLASKVKLETALREVFTDEPSTVTRANVSPERKRKMKIAIGFAKARKAGAKLPKKKGT